MSNLLGRYVIGDDTPSTVYKEVVKGQLMGKGLIPRNYDEFPVGCYAAAPPWSMDSMPLVPWDEIPDRIAHHEETKTTLYDLTADLVCLDQNGQGYCWAYSGTSAIMVLRKRNNQPDVRLSAHSVAWVIKGGRDEGGWGAAGLDFQRERGVMPVSLWPEKSMQGSKWNTAANWEAAKEFRPTEGFVDLSQPAYDRELSVHQVISCILNWIPVISDYNWWGHSVCMVGVHDVYPNKSKSDPSRYASEILNSWTPNWGNNGRGILKDSKAWPNSASAPRTTWGN